MDLLHILYHVSGQCQSAFSDFQKVGSHHRSRLPQLLSHRTTQSGKADFERCSAGNARRKLPTYPSFTFIETMQNGKADFEQFPGMKNPLSLPRKGKIFSFNLQAYRRYRSQYTEEYHNPNTYRMRSIATAPSCRRNGSPSNRIQ